MGLDLKNTFRKLKYSGLKGECPPERRLVFYHVPKTAGSAVRSALKDLYFDPRGHAKDTIYICNAHTSMKVSQITGRDLMEVREQQLLLALADTNNRLVAGHFAYSPLAYEHYKENLLFMSLLREPVARFLSQYFYNRYKESNHCGLDCSLDEYLESESAVYSTSMYLHYFGRGSECYDQALLNLRGLDVLGVVEDMDSFSNALSEQVDRRVVFPAVRPNPRSNYADEVTPAQRRKIEQMCAADTKLYDAVRNHIA